MHLINTPLPYFGRGNSKLPDSTLTFALPSGFTCPGALHCLSMADRHKGTLTDGPQQRFRCYEASIESLRPSVRARRWENFDLIKHRSLSELADLLAAGITHACDHKTTHVRWFTGGDCFSGTLRDAIFTVAERSPQLIHYFYTKNLPLFLPPPLAPCWPENIRITASVGGKFDHLLPAFSRTARVLDNSWQAAALGLPIDTNDVLAWQAEPLHFCHLSHGMQPAGSISGKFIAWRRKRGEFTGYGSRKRKALQAA